MKITYEQSGVDYGEIDPIKKLAQKAARKTAKNLESVGLSELAETRGESAYVWKQGGVYMASVAEGLGTKNLVADALMDAGDHDTYYDVIGHDTVASIINDLVTVGAVPVAIHAYWAVGDSKFFAARRRMVDLIGGWRSACDIAGVSWGGGETPTLTGIIDAKTIDLASSAVGIIKNKRSLITEKKIRKGDRIILLQSSGVNVNGLSLARALANKLPHRYQSRLESGKTYGESLLNKTNIYAKLIKSALENHIDIHYIVNITGHGLRKLMRADRSFTYILDRLFKPQEVFLFIKDKAGLSDEEIYATFNMGQDYAIFVPEKEVGKLLRIVRKSGFVAIDAGYVESGPRQVVIRPKDLIYKSTALDLR